MWLYMALAGGAGAWSRFMLTQLIQVKLKKLALWATTLINISGSFLLGLCYGMFIVNEYSDSLYLIIGTGFLGAFTTFSTFSYEAYTHYLTSKKKGVLFIVTSVFSALFFSGIAIWMVI